MTTGHTEEVRRRAERFNKERLLGAMRGLGVDAVIALSPANVQYTSGVHIDVHVLPTLVLTSVDGRQAVVINEADAQYFPQQSWIEDVRILRYGPGADVRAYELLADLLREHGLDRSRLGVEGDVLPWNAHETLRRVAPGAELDDATGAFEAARLIKTPAEVDVLAFAASSTIAAICGAFEAKRVPLTELELTYEIQTRLLASGAKSLSHASISAGVRSTMAHAPSTDDLLIPGEVIHVDTGASFDGYVTDLARNAIVGPSGGRPAEIYRHLAEIQMQLIEQVAPGVAAGELFNSAQRAIAAVGLVHPWGTVGHSIGLSVHEGFELAAGSNAVLEAGMVVNVEPSHIEPGDARYHVEDTLLVTADGARLLSDTSPPTQLPSLGGS